MTIRVRESFQDWTNPIGEVRINDPISIAAGQGRDGLAALFIETSGSGAGWAIPDTSEVFFSFIFNPTSLTSNGTVQLVKGNTEIITISVLSDGAVQARRGSSSGTILGTSAAGIFSLSVRTSMQGRIVISDTVGVIEIRVNGSGTPILNLTSVDTKPGADTTVDNFYLGLQVGGGSSSSGYFNDLVVWDATGSENNTWMGELRVTSLFVDANGDSSQFTGSDGNSTDNYLLVDAAAPNGTDYVQSSTVGHKDLYGVQNLSVTPSSIYEVAVCGSALKTDAGSRDVRLLAKSSSTEVEGSTTALSITRERYTYGLATDPATSAAWSVSGVNGVQIGQKVQA